MHFFQVKLKLSLSKMIVALKVIINFTNHFRQVTQWVTNVRWAELLIGFVQQKT